MLSWKLEHVLQSICNYCALIFLLNNLCNYRCHLRAALTAILPGTGLSFFLLPQPFFLLSPFSITFIQIVFLKTTLTETMRGAKHRSTGASPNHGTRMASNPWNIRMGRQSMVHRSLGESGADAWGTGQQMHGGEGTHGDVGARGRWRGSRATKHLAGLRSQSA
jgi:hypothetical protein